MYDNYQVGTMTLIRNHHFSTKRLFVNEWNSFTQDEWPYQNLPNVVMEILSERVTQSLPPSWRGSYTLERAQQWIHERDSIPSACLRTLGVSIRIAAAGTSETAS